MNRLLMLLAAALLAAVLPRPAAAYPSMIRNGYTGCGECHTDPSGGSVLTEYGRGQAYILLSTVYGKRGGDYEPPDTKDFLFGAVPLPDGLALQADLRELLVPEPGAPRFLAMQNDLHGSLDLGIVRADASIGYVSEGAQRAWLTTNTGTGGNVVSRHHWVGAEPVDNLLVRAGRMNLPFGIRSEEHILFARSVTGTDTNAGQEHGLDVAWEGGDFRAEAMGIAGDFQVSPADYRQRGYAATVGWGPMSKLEIGASSMFTTVALDEDLRVPRTRQAHELFGRYAPVRKVALLAEAGLLVDDIDNAGNVTGTVGYVQADFEPIQGVHLKGTGEWCDDDLSDTDSATTRGWLAAQWFVLPHVDLRADALYGSLYCTPGSPASFMGLVQAHAWL